MSLAQAARMRIFNLLIVSVAASAMALVACGGATTGGDGTTTGTGSPKSDPGTAAGTSGASGGSVTGNDPGNDLPQPGIHPPTNGHGPGTVGATCASPTQVSVGPGGSIARPIGSALRLALTYQGSDIGVTEARGVDMLLSKADGPFTPGAVAGYWVETRSAGATIYQHLVQDPTTIEAVGAGGSGFTNLPVDRCAAKIILADVPNNPSITDIVIYGSPYGTNDGAVELGHFTIN
jgi:hypothetical protein